jgi:hypothetical protein
VVDIYLSAGPHEGYGTSGYRSCNNQSYVNCSLYRIRMDLGALRVLDVELVESAVPPLPDCPAGRSHIQPAVSPGGSHFAWVSQCWQTLNIPGAPQGAGDIELRVRATAGGPAGYAVAAGAVARPGGPFPSYPSWADDDTLLYDTGGSSSAQTSMPTVWKTWAWPAFGNTQAVVGPEATPGAIWPKGYEDPDVFHGASPADRPGGGPRMVTFGGGAGRKVPRTTDLSGSDEVGFDLPWTNSLGEPECHHPAWSPDGQQILCTRYQGPEQQVVATPFLLLPHGRHDWSVDYRRLYGFTFGGLRWRDRKSTRLNSSHNPASRMPSSA